MRRFGDYRDGFASGWMQVRGSRRRRGVYRHVLLLLIRGLYFEVAINPRFCPRTWPLILRHNRRATAERSGALHVGVMALLGNE